MVMEATRTMCFSANPLSLSVPDSVLESWLQDSVLTLYFCRFEMPLALLGFVTSYAFWELFKFYVDRWESNHHHPLIRKILIRVALCATVSILAFFYVQIAVLYALAISYSVVILHGGFMNDSHFPRSNLEVKIEKS